MNWLRVVSEAGRGWVRELSNTEADALGEHLL